MKTEAFCRAFRYRAGSIIAPWKNVALQNEPQGDCQDFAWTVLYLETNSHPWRHILTGRAMIWRAKSPVNKTLPRHAILWMKGKGFIDSTDRFWRDTPAPNRLRWPAGLPVILGLVLTARMWGIL